ncbi:lethal (3) 04053 isoform X2 [Rhynchophorus ferrugineus]|uniref:lethal (3) 04053 isoform X2 n=1 Tax=Rhynchophorus ferrugineus TaxID=354439 RepID=UPI003FCD6AA6
MSRESLYKNENSDSESESEGQERNGSRGLGLDLGDDCVHKVKGHRLESQGQSSSGKPESTNSSRDSNNRREDNPFSFKHFLRDSTSSNKNYQSLGARPKVFRDNRPKNGTPPETVKKTAHNSRSSEFSSALPDFVQDHLVMEQCYLGNRTCSSPSYELDLPDFTTTNNVNGHLNAKSSPAGEPIPLDLPGLSIGNPFPLDLPVTANVSGDLPRTTPVSEVGNSQSLPDFLTDGPVRPGNDSIPISPPEPLSNINIRPESCRRCLELRSELAIAHQKVSECQEEADRSNRQATIAENTVHRLKQEIKSLKGQLSHLQSENQLLRMNEGAVGGSDHVWRSRNEIPSSRLAQELRTAASTAELSLRQLLTGVDNLKMMAATLENMHRIEEKPDRFSGNFDDQTGPAL